MGQGEWVRSCSLTTDISQYIKHMSLFQLFDTNVKAGFMFCQEVVPHMKKTG